MILRTHPDLVFCQSEPIDKIKDVLQERNDHVIKHKIFLIKYQQEVDKTSYNAKCLIEQNVYQKLMEENEQLLDEERNKFSNYLNTLSEETPQSQEKEVEITMRIKLFEKKTQCLVEITKKLQENMSQTRVLNVCKQTIDDYEEKQISYDAEMKKYNEKYVQLYKQYGV